MIKHNPKIKKAFETYQKTGDSSELSKELQEVALKDLDENKVFVTAI